MKSIPLSYSQEGVWLLDQSNPSAAVFNSSSVYRIRGAIDLAAFDAALTSVVARHEALRTNVRLVDGVPRGFLAEPAAVRATRHDATGFADSAVDSLLRDDARRPFDAGREPLLRATWVLLGRDDHLLQLCCHHLAADARSLSIIRTDLATAYARAVAGHDDPDPDLGPAEGGHARYAAGQREALASGALDESVRFWTSALRDLPEELPMSTDKPRPVVSDFTGGTVTVEIGDSRWRMIREFAADEWVTPFMLVHAALSVLLSRYANDRDVVVGTALLNRRQHEQASVGLFVNLAALRLQIDPDATFREVLRSARDCLLDAVDNQRVPFELILSSLRRRVGLGHRQVFQVILQALDRTEGLELVGLDVRPCPDRTTIPIQFDLGVNLVTQGGRAQVTVTYRRDLFDNRTVRRLGQRLLLLIDQAMGVPDAPVRTLGWVLPEERHQLIEWNRTTVPLPAARSVADLVLAQAARRPAAVAMVDGDTKVSYQELADRARAVAHRLIGDGVRPGSVVGVIMPRGWDLAAVQLGIWLAGCGYLVCNLRDPGVRMGYQIDQAQVTTAVVAAELAGQAPSSLDNIIVAHDIPPAPDTGGSVPAPPAHGLADVAYVVYTSGSTGRPKGVVIEHRGALNLVSWHHRTFGTNDSDRTTISAVPSFDAWTLEVWPALAAGATLIFAGEYVPTADALQEWLLAEGITLTHLTTPLAETILDLPWPPMIPLRALLTGSERLSARDWSRVPFEVWNGYGPTESTVICSSGPVPRDLHPAVFPRVGRPLDNTCVQILDSAGACVPIGVPGEVFVGGTGLARHYLGPPELTTERFVMLPDPAGRVARFYRTGDIARWRNEGDIEFIGRRDEQVKIRGFRIELKEIEAALSRYPGIRRSAVIMRTSKQGEKRLLGYVVPKPGAALSSLDLRDHLTSELPEYMIPRSISVLDRLPLLSNGKLDRLSLPEPDDAPVHSRRPESAMEELMCTIFADALGLNRVDADSNFFELGGHSLMAGQLVSRIRVAFGADVSILSIFTAPTPAKMVGQLSSGTSHLPLDVLVALRPSGRQEPLFCIHPGAGIGWSYSALLPYVPPEHPLYAVQAHGLRGGGEQLPDLDGMAADYVSRIRAVRPRGPYHLLGWSFGGVVAYLVACRLRQAGHEVATLTLLDAYPGMVADIPLEPAEPTGLLEAVLRSLGYDGTIENSPLAGLKPEQLRSLAAIAHHHAMILPQFRPAAFDGDVLFVRATARRHRGPEPDAWNKVVRGNVATVDIECEHGRLLQPQNVKVLGPIIAGWLERASIA